MGSMRKLMVFGLALDSSFFFRLILTKVNSGCSAHAILFFKCVSQQTLFISKIFSLKFTATTEFICHFFYLCRKRGREFDKE